MLSLVKKFKLTSAYLLLVVLLTSFFFFSPLEQVDISFQSLNEPKIVPIIIPSSQNISFEEEVSEINETIVESQESISFSSSSSSSSKSLSSSTPTSEKIPAQPTQTTSVILQSIDENKIKALGGEIISQTGPWYEVVIPIEKKDQLASEYRVWENNIYLPATVQFENQSQIVQLNKTKQINATIAIVDTGISQYAISGEESFVQGEDAFDYNGHGTGIASVIQSVTNVSLLNAKALNRFGQGTTFTILSAIYWSVEQGADVISLSLGSPTKKTDEPLQEAINHAIQNNVIVVAASGNCAKGCNGFSGVTSPGSLESVITVGAVNDRYEVAPFSGYERTSDSQKPDIVAPGVGIEVTSLDGLKVVSGTSIATPYVAVVAAMKKSYNKSISQNEMKAYFHAQAVDIDKPGIDEKSGHGYIPIINYTQSDDPLLQVPSSYRAQPYRFSKTVPLNISDQAIIINPQDFIWSELNETITFNDSQFQTQFGGNDACAFADRVAISGFVDEAIETQGDEDWFEVIHPNTVGILRLGFFESNAVDIVALAKNTCTSSAYCVYESIGQDTCSDFSWFYVENDDPSSFVQVYGYASIYSAFASYTMSVSHALASAVELAFDVEDGRSYEIDIYFDNNYITSVDAIGNNLHIVDKKFLFASSSSTNLEIIARDKDTREEFTYTRLVDLTHDRVSYATFTLVNEQCNTGDPCCNSDGTYKPTSYICDSAISEDIACFYGVEPGDDVGVKYLNQYCSGSSGACDGDTEWGNIEVYESCSTSEVCSGISQTCIDKDDACPFPDGSSTACSCQNDNDCPNGFACNQRSGPNNCVAISYEDECSNYNDYYCKNGDVYLCQNTGLIYEEVFVESCGVSKFCDPTVVDGTASCTIIAENKDLWFNDAEIYAPLNVQVGDTFTLNMFAENSYSYPVQINDDGILSSCSTWDVSVGLNTCDFTAIQKGRYEITVNYQDMIVNVIDPAVLIVTDSNKLTQRYITEQNGVQALLRQSYDLANQHGGVVYDLADYSFSNHPFNSFAVYDERFDYSAISNEYTYQVASFIKQKCGSSCKDVIIVGDDFVVPYERKQISTFEKNFIFFSEERVDTLYTDSHFIKKDVSSFGSFHEFLSNPGNFPGKDVAIIWPNDPSFEPYIESLKQTISTVYDSDITDYKSDVFCIDERFFAPLKDKTVILIGDKTTNTAIAECYPFSNDDLNVNSMYLQNSVWDSDQVSLILNVDNPVVLEAVSELIKSGLIGEMKTRTQYYVEVGTDVVSWVAVGASAVALTAGSGGTLAVAGMIAVGVNALADVSDIGNECFVNKDGVGACSMAIGFVLLPEFAEKSFKTIKNVPLSVVKKVDNLGEDYFHIGLEKLKNSQKISKDVFDSSMKDWDDVLNLGAGVRKIEDVTNKNIDEFFDDILRIPDESRSFSSVEIQQLKLRYVESVGHYDLLIKSREAEIMKISDIVERNNQLEELQKKISEFDEIISSEPNKGSLGELMSLRQETQLPKSVNVNIDEPFIYSGKWYKPQNEGGLIGEIDLLRENGDIIEVKFRNINKVPLDINKQLENYIAYQMVSPNSGNKVIERTFITSDQLTEINMNAVRTSIRRILDNMPNANVKVEWEIIDPITGKKSVEVFSNE